MDAQEVRRVVIEAVGAALRSDGPTERDVRQRAKFEIEFVDLSVTFTAQKIIVRREDQ